MMASQQRPMYTMSREVPAVGEYRPGVVPGKIRVALYLDEELERELRLEAALSRESRSAIAEAAIRRELRRRRAEREKAGAE